MIIRKLHNLLQRSFQATFIKRRIQQCTGFKVQRATLNYQKPSTKLGFSLKLVTRKQELFACLRTQ